MKKYAREAFYNNIELSLTDSYDNNKRYFWKLVRFFIKSNNANNSIPPLKIIEDNTECTYFSDFEKANCLNNYFVSISTINDEHSILPPYALKTNNSLDTILLNESEITDVLKILNINKACGNDSVSHKMLKNVSCTISKALCILFNKSLTECRFPSSWKESQRYPII